MSWSSPRKLLSGSVGSALNSTIIACVYWERSDGDGRSGLDWTIPSTFWTLCGLVCECCGSAELRRRLLCRKRPVTQMTHTSLPQLQFSLGVTVGQFWLSCGARTRVVSYPTYTLIALLTFFPGSWSLLVMPPLCDHRLLHVHLLPLSSSVMKFHLPVPWHGELWPRVTVASHHQCPTQGQAQSQCRINVSCWMNGLVKTVSAVSCNYISTG